MLYISSVVINKICVEDKTGKFTCILISLFVLQYRNLNEERNCMEQLSVQVFLLCLLSLCLYFPCLSEENVTAIMTSYLEMLLNLSAVFDGACHYLLFKRFYESSRVIPSSAFPFTSLGCLSSLLICMTLFQPMFHPLPLSNFKST